MESGENTVVFLPYKLNIFEIFAFYNDYKIITFFIKLIFIAQNIFIYTQYSECTESLSSGNNSRSSFAFDF